MHCKPAERHGIRIFNRIVPGTYRATGFFEFYIGDNLLTALDRGREALALFSEATTA